LRFLFAFFGEAERNADALFIWLADLTGVSPYRVVYRSLRII